MTKIMKIYHFGVLSVINVADTNAQWL